MVGIADLRRIWPDRVFIDEAEVMRLEDVQVYVLPFRVVFFFFWGGRLISCLVYRAKIRGKGAPKKQRTKKENTRKRK